NAASRVSRRRPTRARGRSDTRRASRPGIPRPRGQTVAPRRTPDGGRMTTVDGTERENRALLAAFLATTAASVAALWLWIELAVPRNAWTLVWRVVGLLSVPGKYVVFAGLTPATPLGPWGLAVVGLVADAWLALGLAALLAPLRRLRWI